VAAPDSLALLRHDPHIFFHVVELVKRFVEKIEVLQNLDLQICIDIVQVFLVLLNMWIDLVSRLQSQQRAVYLILFAKEFQRDLHLVIYFWCFLSLFDRHFRGLVLLLVFCDLEWLLLGRSDLSLQMVHPLPLLAFSVGDVSLTKDSYALQVLL
jgi:hypothetical protein